MVWTPPYTTTPAGASFNLCYADWDITDSKYNMGTPYTDGDQGRLPLTNSDVNDKTGGWASVDFATGKFMTVNSLCNGSKPFDNKPSYIITVNWSIYITTSGSAATCKMTPMSLPAICTATINSPTLSAVSFADGAEASVTAIPAFTDTYTPTGGCGSKTCQSSSLNVVWSQTNQQFTFASITPYGPQTVILTCSMTSFSDVLPVSSNLSLTFTPSCTTTQMIAPTLTSVTIQTRSSTVTTITSQFQDSISNTYGSGSGVDQCGARSCSVSCSTCLYTYVTYSSNQFTVQAPQSGAYMDTTGTYQVTLSCGLASYSGVAQARASFSLIVNACSFSQVTQAGITSAQTLTYSLLSSSLVTLITPVTTDTTCNGYTYVYNVETQSGQTWSSNLSAIGATLSGSTLTILNSNSAATQGTFAFRWYMTSTNNPSMTPVYVNFNVVITPCVVTSATLTSPPTGWANFSQTIFAAAQTFSVGTFTQTPACNFSPTYNQVQSQSQSGQAAWVNSQPFLSISVNQLSVYSNDLTLKGQVYNIRYLVNIGTFSLTSPSIAVTFVDPCLQNTFIAPVGPIQTYVYFISAQNSLLQFKLPWLNDQVNLLYGTSTTISICQNSITILQESGLAVTYTTLTQGTDGTTTVSLQQQDVSLAGAHTLTAVYSFQSYPLIAAFSTNTNFVLQMYQILIPQVKDQQYTVKNAMLSFQMNSFSTNPVSSTVQVVQTVVQANGKAVPYFLSYTISSTQINFKVLSTSNSDAGTYKIQVSATITGGGQTYNTFVQFGLVILAGTSGQAPSFSTSLGGPYVLQVGQNWQLQIPSYSGAEGLNITQKVEMDKSMLFLAQKNQKLVTLRQIESSDVGSYTIYFILKDSSGATSKQAIQISVVNVADNSTLTTANNNQTSISPTVETQKEVDTSFLPELNTPEWNWDDVKRNATQNSKSIKPPIVSIKEISMNGVMKLKFTKFMSAPANISDFQVVAQPLNNRNDTQITQNLNTTARMLRGGRFPFALNIEMAPGNGQNASNLNFQYNVTSYANKTMTIQLLFDKAQFVNSQFKQDYVYVSFPSFQYIFDTDGNLLKNAKQKLRHMLPAQLQFDTLETNMLTEAITVLQTATQGFMVSNVVINLLLSAALNQLFSMVECHQIIILMPLFNLRMPANAAMFYNFLMTIASFDLIPLQNLYEDWFPDLPPTDGLNANFDQLGFTEMYFIFNVGSIILGFAAIPVQLLVYLLLLPFRKYARVQSVMNWLWYRTFWNNTIKTIQESFVIVFICVCINLDYVSQNFKFFQLKNEDPGQIYSNILTILFAAVTISFPFVAGIFLCVKFDILDEERMRQKYGALYKELNLHSGKGIIVYVMYYFIRRMLIPLSVIYNDHLIVQVMVMSYTVTGNIIIVGQISPFEGGKFAYYMNLFHEAIILLVMYTMMMFTDFVPDLETRSYIGYASMFLVVAHLAICIGFMIKDSILDLITKIKAFIAKRRNKAIQVQVENLKMTREKFQFVRKAIVGDTALVAVTQKMEQIYEVDGEFEESQVSSANASLRSNVQSVSQFSNRSEEGLSKAKPKAAHNESETKLVTERTKNEKLLFEQEITKIEDEFSTASKVIEVQTSNRFYEDQMEKVLYDVSKEEIFTENNKSDWMNQLTLIQQDKPEKNTLKENQDVVAEMNNIISKIKAQTFKNSSSTTESQQKVSEITKKMKETLPLTPYNTKDSIMMKIRFPKLPQTPTAQIKPKRKPIDWQISGGSFEPVNEQNERNKNEP